MFLPFQTGGSLELNLGHQAWWQTLLYMSHLASGPPLPPSFKNIFVSVFTVTLSLNTSVSSSAFVP